MAMLNQKISYRQFKRAMFLNIALAKKLSQELATNFLVYTMARMRLMRVDGSME